MADDIVQVIQDAREDATSLSEFIYYPANTMVERRLAPSIHTLNYYLDYLHGLELIYSQPTGTVTVNGEEVKTVRQAINDSIDSAILGDYQTQLETRVGVNESNISSLQSDFTNLPIVDGKVPSSAVSTSVNTSQEDNNTTYDSFIVNQTLKNTEYDSQKYDIGIIATAKFGGVERAQADVNAETVSLLDFGAPYSTDSSTHLQAALDYLDSVGGGVLTIPFHTGKLVINSVITLYENITVDCADNLVIQCPDNTVPYMFRLEGSIDATEYPLTANAKDGDISLSFSSALSVNALDDLMLVSQRECASVDAGEDWLLGDTTANTVSPHFAEPVIVSKVVSAGNVTLQTPLLFPSYRTDKTLETSPTARASSTVQKINFKKGFKWKGGVFKRESRSIFYLVWTKDCSIDTSFSRGYGIGQEIVNTYSYRNFIKAKVRRPSDWVMTESHEAYNSVKDVSSWFTEAYLDEDSGSQGLDQTYKLYPCIFPKYRIVHTNSREAAMTTHGNCYGADIKVYGANCQNYAYYGRARFTTASVVAINCKGAVILDVAGALDSNYRVFANNLYFVGFRVDATGVVGITPAKKNLTLSGQIYMSPNAAGDAILFGDNVSTTNKYADSGIVLKDLKIRSVSRAITLGQYNHRVTFDNVNIKHYGVANPIYIRNSNSAIIKNLTVEMKGAAIQTPPLKALFGSPLLGASDVAAYPNPAWRIDYDSCKIINGELVADDIRYVMSKTTLNGTSSSTAFLRIDNTNLAKILHAHVTSGTVSENRVTVDTSLPVGMEVSLMITSASPTFQVSLYGLSGVDLEFLPSVANFKSPRIITIAATTMIRIMKISATKAIVY